MRVLIITVVLTLCARSCFGQKQFPLTPTVLSPEAEHLSNKIRNFSIVILHHTAKEVGSKNFIMSPFPVYKLMCMIAEGAYSTTYRELRMALGLSTRSSLWRVTRPQLGEILSRLDVRTNTVEVAKRDLMFVNKDIYLNAEYAENATRFYQAQVSKLDFGDTENTARIVNAEIANATRGRIQNVVQPSDFAESIIFLSSIIYFKGQWTAPFEKNATTRMPFFDEHDQKIGEVNMMYNRFNYPFANIEQIQARVLELPYGVENRLSMLILLPYAGVTLDTLFLNFLKIPITKVFEEMRIAKEEYSEDEVDCYLPRFKIETDIKLTETLKKVGIHQLFDSKTAQLHVALPSAYVNKVSHKAEIEVTEDGTTASAVASAEFGNRIGVARFVANKPFTYLIIEKSSSTIVFGGIYSQPSLY